MQNKKTGPVTLPGKEASSKNALKHGATSPKLINESEQERYKTLLGNLKKRYSSDNPLIELQVERIARTTIQLERIQNVIDAAFIKSRLRANTAEKLIETLARENFVISGIAEDFFSRSFRKCENPREIATELMNQVDIDSIQSINEFKEQLPLLTKHISRQDSLSEDQINVYLINEVTQLSDRHKKICNSLSDSDDPETVNLMLLKLFAVWHATTLKELISDPSSSMTISQSLELEEDAILPEAQDMDRLMRYQTTLQRQLSTATGELLEIYKIEKMKLKIDVI